MPQVPDLPRPWRLLVGIASSFLLITMGAQIVAAPLTLPLLWLAARSSKGAAGRWTFIVIGAMTATFGGWYLAYLLIGERQPFIGGIPGLCFISTIAAFGLTMRRSSPPARKKL